MQMLLLCVGKLCFRQLTKLPEILSNIMFIHSILKNVSVLVLEQITKGRGKGGDFQ